MQDNCTFDDFENSYMNMMSSLENLFFNLELKVKMCIVKIIHKNMNELYTLKSSLFL